MGLMSLAKETGSSARVEAKKDGTTSEPHTIARTRVRLITMHSFSTSESQRTQRAMPQRTQKPWSQRILRIQRTHAHGGHAGHGEHGGHGEHRGYRAPRGSAHSTEYNAA